MATALANLMSAPHVLLAPHATPVNELHRLRHHLGSGCPRLLMKRDDLLSFGCGGNKVRKLQTVVAEARADGADVLITCGGVQSNHARVTAATGAALGLDVILVLNGARPDRLSGNALLDDLFGADMRYVSSRDLRDSVMEEIAGEMRAAGRRPWIIPLGASTASGAIGFARGVAEIVTDGIKPTVIVHATSSGGTQAGLLLGTTLFGMRTRVVGVSADESSAVLTGKIVAILGDAAARLGASLDGFRADETIDVDDRFIGGGYGIPTPESTEAIRLVARTEGVLLDPVYTAKAMAGLLARIHTREFERDDTVLFWHTGGVPAMFTNEEKRN